MLHILIPILILMIVVAADYSHDRHSSLFSLDSNLQYCQQPAKCQPLNFTDCMGASLPYSFTTLDLINNALTQEEVKEQLQMWRGLIHVPKCWIHFQPFLCALYVPKCENSTVDLPSQEMCKKVSDHCKILMENNLWPSLFRCDNTTLFPPRCKYDVRKLRSNITGRCKAPLVQTYVQSSFYDGIEGCGVQCEEPMLTPEELSQIRRWATSSAAISALFNSFAVITFLLDWKASNKYPALVIFYINLCLLIVCIGWIYPVLFNSHEDVVCRKDNTLRISEPSVGENISCVANFVLVYYFLIAAMVWFVIQTYAWYFSFQALGKIQSRMDKQGAYFHLVAWSLPLVLTITVMALSKVDGSSVFGICFVGGQSPVIRTLFLLVPIAVATSVGGFFLSKALLTLICLKKGSKEIISERASTKIRNTIVKMIIFSLLIICLVLITFTYHIYQFKHVSLWKKSFRQFIVCQLGISFDKDSAEENCRMEERPSVFMIQLQVLALFSMSILMSMWVWNKSSIITWKRFFCKNSEDKEVKLQKHKIIARAFAKRKMLNRDGRFSITFQSSRQDPVGLNFELESLGTRGDLSSTWAAALPKLMMRRCALTGVTKGSNSSQHRNSFDSEVSYSVRRFSVESRRHSLDSTVSVQAVELTGVVRKAVRHKKGRHGSRNTQVFPLENSRSSSTSQESTLGAQILTALSIGSEVPETVPNLKRRSASAGLESNLDAFAGKLISQLNTVEFNSVDGTSEVSEDSFTDQLFTNFPTVET